jgi:hypothetical protein
MNIYLNSKQFSKSDNTAYQESSTVFGNLFYLPGKTENFEKNDFRRDFFSIILETHLYFCQYLAGVFHYIRCLWLV